MLRLRLMGKRLGTLTLGVLVVAFAAGCSSKSVTKAEASPPVNSAAGVLAEPSAKPTEAGAAENGLAETGPTKADYDAAVAGADPAAIERLLAKMPKFADGQGHEYYVFEGDLPYTEEGIRAAVAAERAKRAKHVTRVLQPELKLELADAGKRLYWARNERKLTYAVDRASFAAAPAGTYKSVVDAMAAAAGDWERLCAACGLTIRHAPAVDATADLSKVTFVVRYTPQPSSFIALGFFPGALQDQRVMWVFSRYPTTTFDHTGVFRHELGHVLGYAHEHLDALSGCAKTDDDWVGITPYDPKSVMHYICGDHGDAHLALTDCDAKGHAQVYGAPAGAPPPTGQSLVNCKGSPA
jgi:hypothetical protein